MQQQWFSKDEAPSGITAMSASYKTTNSGDNNQPLARTFSMSVMELEQKLQERLHTRAAAAKLTENLVATPTDPHQHRHQAAHKAQIPNDHDEQPTTFPVHLLPQNVLEQLLLVAGSSSSKSSDRTSRPPPKASCAWHSSKQRRKFQHLIDQPICTCGAGRDISFLHDSRRYMRPYAVEGDVAKTALAEDHANNTILQAQPEGSSITEREARVDEIRQHLSDSFLPDEYHLVRSHGVEGLDVVESRFCTTTEAHKRHATAFPALIPTGRQQVKHLRQVMQNLLERLDFGGKLTNLKGPSVVHRLVELVKQEQSIYNLVFHELIRQCTVECVERGQLLADVRQQYADLLARVPEMLLGWHNEWLAQRALDRRLQEEVIVFKNELERLETELARIDTDDTHLSQEAFQLRRTLCEEVKVSRDNAVQLSDYHELYELQRKRLEKQINDLVNERAAWIRAAYQLAIKYVDDRHLEPIHSLHLSHRSWFHLAKQIMQVYDVSERRDLADLSRVVSEDWTRHMQRLESRLLKNEVEITRELRRLQAEMLHLLKQIRFTFDETEAASKAEKHDMRKEIKRNIVNWSQTLFALKLFISGEELSRTVRYVRDIESISETWVSLAITLFRRHYRPLTYPGQPTQSTKTEVDVYKDWQKQQKSQKKKRRASMEAMNLAKDDEPVLFHPVSDGDEETGEVSDAATSTAAVEQQRNIASETQKPEEIIINSKLSKKEQKQQRYSMIERQHQQSQYSRKMNRKKANAEADGDDVDDRVDGEQIFPLLSKEEWQDMVAQYHQFVPSNMREQVNAYFAPLQAKPEFAELYRMDVDLKELLSEQRSRMSGDDGVGSSLQKIDDDIHYIELMRSADAHDNNSISEEQLIILRDRLPTWFGLCETCIQAVEKHIPVVEKSEPTKTDEKLNEEEQKALQKSKSNSTAAQQEEEIINEHVVSMTRSAELVARIKRWHTLVQLQLKARDESLHERLSEINQNMLRLLVDSIVLASMCGQEALDGPMPNDQPEPDVLTAAAQVDAANSPVADSNSKRDARFEMMKSFYSRAVWTHDEVADCSRALLHATDELEPDLLTGSKSVNVFRDHKDHSNDVVRAANGARWLTTLPVGGVRIDFDWAERDQLSKESDEWCRAMSIVTNVLSRTHKFPQFRMAIHIANKHNDNTGANDAEVDAARGSNTSHSESKNDAENVDDLTFEEFTQRRLSEYEKDFRLANTVQVRCLGDDDNIYVRKIKLDGELPTTLATESAIDALKHARKLTLETESRCKDAENRATTLENELLAAQDTISDLRTEIQIKSAELERLTDLERGSPSGKSGKKSSKQHSGNTTSKTGRAGNKSKPSTPTNLLVAPSPSTQSASAASSPDSSMGSSPSPGGSRIASAAATSGRASSSLGEGSPGSR